jgi:catechol 2,3-dioxygenase-like lactoylglutathione lyase family enzyme
MSIKFQSTVLFVRDIAESRRFYESLLGQKIQADFGLNVGFEGGLALWQFDHAYSNVFGRPPETTDKLGRDNLEVYFETDDIQGVWNALAAASVPAVHEPREQPWGQSVFRVYDPDGHVVEIGEPMAFVVQRFASQGLTVDEIAQRTFMPCEIVERIVSGGRE